MKEGNVNKLSFKKLMIMLSGAVLLILAMIFFSGHHSNSLVPEGGGVEAVVSAVKASILSSPMNFMPIDWVIARDWIILGMFGYGFLMLMYMSMVKENRREGIEHGSAGWLSGDLRVKFFKEFTNTAREDDIARETGHGNRIFSQNIKMSSDGKKLKGINNNEVVIGGSGTGKSRFYVKPNILQANGSYVITDPAGELLHDTGDFLKGEGYEVKVLNLVEMDKSMGYNPFMYIRKKDDALKMMSMFINNTTDPDAAKGEPIWGDLEKMLLTSLMDYLIETYPVTDDMPEEERMYNMSKQSFPEILELLLLEEISEDDPDKPSELVLLMQELQAKDPNSPAVENFLGYRQGTVKQIQSIIISARARLAPFTSSPQVKELLKWEELDLGSLGDKKTALFIITPIIDNTYNFVASMLYTQLFDVLYHKAETEYNGGELPVNVSLYLDEFANLGKIPNFKMITSTIRKYGINVKIILQSMSQIKALYKDDWEGIIGNCAVLIYLGGNEFSTHEWISKMLGKETVVSTTESKSFSKTNSKSRNKAILGRDLLSPDEVGRIDRDMSIIKITGMLPIYDKKFDYPSHPNYKHTADSDKSKAYSFVPTRLTRESINKFKPLQQVEVRQLSFMKEFTAPEVNRFNDILSEDMREQVSRSTYYIGTTAGEKFSDIKLYSMSFYEFIQEMEANHLEGKYADVE